MKADRRLVLIFIVILLDNLGIGLLIPTFPKIIQRFSVDPQLLSQYFGWFVGAYALMQFIAAPILGSLSDRWGRKPILIGSLLGAALDYVMMAFAPTYSWLLLGRIIAGVTGASMTVASSYITDISSMEKRTQNFGLIGAAWGLGFIAGPVIGALLDLFHPYTPFFVAAALNLSLCVFAFFLLPESLPSEDRRIIHLKQLNPIHSLMTILRRSDIALLVWIYFFLFLASQVMAVNWTLYTQHKFHWTSLQLGFSLSLIGLIIAISQPLLTRMFIPKLGEERALAIGLFFSSVCFLLFAIATEGWMMYGTILLFALTGLANPSLQTMMSRGTPANQQGELQGSLVSLGSFTSVIAPLLFTPIYVRFTNPDSSLYFPGIIFLIASIVIFIIFTVWLLYLRRKTS